MLSADGVTNRYPIRFILCIVTLVAVTATGAGIGVIAHPGAGGLGHGFLVAVSGSWSQYNAAVPAGLRIVTDGGETWGMALRGNNLMVVGVAAGAFVKLNILTAASAVCRSDRRFPVVAQGIGVVMLGTVLTEEDNIRGNFRLAGSRIR